MVNPSGTTALKPFTAPGRLTVIADAALYAGVSTRTIHRWIAAGTLAGYKLGPKLVRVSLDDVDAMLRPITTGGSDVA